MLDALNRCCSFGFGYVDPADAQPEVIRHPELVRFPTLIQRQTKQAQKFVRKGSAMQACMAMLQDNRKFSPTLAQGDPMRKSAMERAFELARSGRFKVSKDIDRTLKAEGYTNVEIALLGLGSVRKDLLRVCRDARGGPTT